jgi:hypothetical protein
MINMMMSGEGRVDEAPCSMPGRVGKRFRDESVDAMSGVRLRLSVQKILIDRETSVVAFFWMKLRRENVIAPNSRRKAPNVLRRCGNDGWVCRFAIVGMDIVEAITVGKALKHCVCWSVFWCHCHVIPTHMGDFCGCFDRLKASHLTAKDAKPRGIAFF